MRNKFTTEDFILLSKKKYGDKYDYSKAVYVNKDTRICLINKDGSESYVLLRSHLNLSKEESDNYKKEKTIKAFFEEMTKKYNGLYDYSESNCTSMNEPVKIRCTKHNVYFYQTPSAHKKSAACPVCRVEELELDRIEREKTFIENAKKVHGDLYDYSKVHYVNNETPITIIDKEYGEFQQLPITHLSGHGCPKRGLVAMAECSVKRHASQLDELQAKFIEKAKLVHGDKYDYSKVKYVNNTTDVCIICPKHGEFWQSPSSHVQGSSCRKCANESLSEKYTYTTEEFIRKSKERFGDKFKYDKTVYKNSTTPLTIFCPSHGYVDVIPSVHLSTYGCPRCGIEHMSNARKMGLEKFVELAKAKFGERYDYSNVEYVNTDTPVTIICKTHGKFSQTPYSHLHSTIGCPSCASIEVGNNQITPFEDFVAKANEVHGNKYTYCKEEYTKASGLVKIICPTHGAFYKIGTHHLNGEGCPRCGIVVSKAEIEMREFIESIVGKNNVVGSDRTVLDNSEIDILATNLNIGFEFDGLRWHSDKFRDCNYHLNKTINSKKKNVKLIHIFEDEWNKNNDKVKSFIRSLFNSYDKTIDTINSNVCEINSCDCEKFMEENCLLNCTPGDINLGVFDCDGSMVSSMSLTYDDSEQCYEILSYANKLNTNTPNSFDVLFNYFKSNYQPNKVLMYIDRRLYDEKDLNGTEFVFCKELAPDYYYVLGTNKRISKYDFQQLYKTDNNELTETQFCELRGLAKIYDCGKLVFKYVKDVNNI